MSGMSDPSPARVLVTGAGGAAGIAVIRALSKAGCEVHAVDCDALATGLHLVEPSRRAVLPRGDDPAFMSALLSEALARGIDVLIPTVDEELSAAAGSRAQLNAHGIELMCSDPGALATCLDKFELVRAVGDVVPCPRTELLDDDFNAGSWEFPVAVKPRRGRGGRGFEVVEDASRLHALPSDGSMIVQELLPGAEYSVDVLVARDGRVVAAVPRERMRVDSGVATVARTLHDDELERVAGYCAVAAGIRGAANVQLRRDRDGRARLLEVNPRFPGTLAITIAAGVDLPLLALRDALGHPLPPAAGDFEDVGMVRMLEDRVVSADELCVSSILDTRQAPAVAL